MSAQRILIVDDEEPICRLCFHALERLGLDATWTTRPSSALASLREEQFDLLVTDIHMPGFTGIELMRAARETAPAIGILVMTAHSTLDIAIDAMKQGANHFIQKPFQMEELEFAVKAVMQSRQLLHENVRLKALVHLVEAAEKINTVHDPTRLYEVVMEAALRETGATRGRIYELDGETYELGLRYEAGERPAEQDPEPEEILPETLAIPLQTQKKLKGVLSLFSDQGHAFSKTDVDIATILGTQAAVALENAELFQEVESLFLSTIKTLASTLDEKDPYTQGHSERVAAVAVEIGERMQLEPAALETLGLAGSLHDIGKIGIPDSILQKPGKLTAEEYEVIKTHPGRGAKILRHIKRLREVTGAVYTHHEWYDGRGYPRGLKGSEIPLNGAIIGAADALDSITGGRHYQRCRPASEAYRILREEAGGQFHPDVVEAIMRAPLVSLREAVGKEI